MDDKIQTGNIQDLIFTIRGFQVMLDEDLAVLYHVELKRLNEQVKRNQQRFPSKFMFQLNKEEWQSLRSQIATLEKSEEILTSLNATTENRGTHRKYLPFVFTEQGVSMLSAVLRSEMAIKVSIRIMDAFIEMRKFLFTNAAVFQRIENVEQKQLETDHKIDQIFKAIEDKSLKPKQGIFFDGQIFDAYLFVSDLIKQATTSIIVIDNYVNETTFALLAKRKANVEATVYTRENTQLLSDIKKYCQQYPLITIKNLTKSHDRFIILDNKTVYHFGASLKDLGKKWFAFSKMEIHSDEILKRLESNYENI